MYQTTHNQTIDFTPEGPTLNGEPFAWDLVKLNDRMFHIIRNDRSFTAEVLDLNAADKTVRLSVNGHIHDIKLKDRFDLLLEKMGIANAASAKVSNLKAPMPGLVVGVNIKPGDVVQQGDSLLILEAMKMENILKSPTNAVIKTIHSQTGDRVEKGQVLVEFV